MRAKEWEQKKNSAACAAALSKKTSLPLLTRRALLRDVAQSHFDALMDAALVTCRRAALDVTLARRPVDQRKGAIHDRLQVAMFLGSQRATHGANLVAQSGPRETIKCSAPLGLTDPFERLNTICHLLLVSS